MMFVNTKRHLSPFAGCHSCSPSVKVVGFNRYPASSNLKVTAEYLVPVKKQQNGGSGFTQTHIRPNQRVPIIPSTPTSSV